MYSSTLMFRLNFLPFPIDRPKWNLDTAGSAYFCFVIAYLKGKGSGHPI